MRNKEAITRVFEALGPERVERAMVAFKEYARQDSSRCFLARTGEIPHRSDVRFRELEWKRLGIDDNDACKVATAYDFWPDELRALAEEWLELNTVTVPLTLNTAVAIGAANG